MTSRAQNWFLLALLALLLLLPLIGSRYLMDLAIQIMIYGLFALSLNVISGHIGNASFGHAAFFAIGGYACAYFQTTMNLPLAVSFLGAVAITALCALVIGFFCVRMSNIYFGMLTLAFSMLVWAVATKWKAVTGGGDGFVAISVPDFLQTPLAFFWFTLAVVTICVIALWILSNSAMGKVFIAIRENPVRAGFLGINVKRMRLVAFVVAGAFAGVAGFLLALYVRGMFPESAYWTASGQVLIMVLLGGIYSFVGPLLGAAVLYLLQVIISQYTEYWQFILGVILMAIVLFAPEGLIGIFRTLGARLERRPAQMPLETLALRPRIERE